MVYVSLGLMTTNGFTFHPWPSSREAFRALPFSSVAMPPLPGSPVGFSGLMDLVFASLSKNKLPGLMFKPLNPELFCADAIVEIKRTMNKSFLIKQVEW